MKWICRGTRPSAREGRAIGNRIWKWLALLPSGGHTALPTQATEEVPPNPQPPALPNGVCDHDGEEFQFPHRLVTANSPAHQEPHSGCRDSQPASVLRRRNHRSRGGLVLYPLRATSPLLLRCQRSSGTASNHQNRLRRMKSG
jgi:hypothetical protein